MQQLLSTFIYHNKFKLSDTPGLNIGSLEGEIGQAPSIYDNKRCPWT